VASEKIKRYDSSEIATVCEIGGILTPAPTGRWVEYSDYEALRAASSAAADEVGRLREQIETLRNRDAVLDYIRDHCKVIAWPGAGAYPIEHNPIAGKDSWKDIALIAYAQARTATDASVAMKHIPTTGGQGEGGKNEQH